MIYMTKFNLDTSRSSEWLAVLWQGPGPAKMKVREWLTLKDVKPHTAILIWEGDEEALAFVERVYGGFGKIETQEVTSSSGMAAAIARDLNAYETMMNGRGGDPKEIARQVDLRRRGMDAPSPSAAIEAAHAWSAEG